MDSFGRSGGRRFVFLISFFHTMTLRVCDSFFISFPQFFFFFPTSFRNESGEGKLFVSTLMLFCHRAPRCPLRDGEYNLPSTSPTPSPIQTSFAVLWGTPSQSRVRWTSHV